MRVVHLIAPRKLAFETAPDPAIRRGEVLVRLKEVAICGSDLVAYLGTQPREYPDRLGRPSHECVGIVVESTLDGYRPGDRVLYFPPHQDGLRELVVATDPIQLLKLPAEGNISEWMMAQLLGTIIHSTRKLGTVMSDRIAVIGQGPVGQLFNHLLWNLGARMVIGIDKVPARLVLSPRMHATHTFQVGKDDVREGIQSLTGGCGADVVVEASGYDETLAMMVDIVRRDGRVLMFGQPKHLAVAFPIMEMYEKRLRVITTHGPDVDLDIRTALEYIQQGRIDVKPILTHRFPLDRIQDAYELFAERKDGCVKVVVEFP